MSAVGKILFFGSCSFNYAFPVCKQYLNLSSSEVLYCNDCDFKKRYFALKTGKEKTTQLYNKCKYYNIVLESLIWSAASYIFSPLCEFDL